MRARDGINQTQLAKLAGVSRQTISLIERNEYTPSVKRSDFNEISQTVRTWCFNWFDCWDSSRYFSRRLGWLSTSISF
nr:helix-turn-helix domain-containing protein [Streptococcus ictaluri]